MKNIPCRLGLHNWKYTVSVYESDQHKKLAIPSKMATRICKKCSEKQFRYEHCLGLNPPEYIYVWGK